MRESHATLPRNQNPAPRAEVQARKAGRRALVLALLSGPAYAEPNLVEVFETGSKTVACACRMVAAGCEPGLPWDSSGSAAHVWSQLAFLRAGVRTDLSRICWDARERSDGGKGLCCGRGDQDPDLDFFRGDLQPEDAKRRAGAGSGTGTPAAGGDAGAEAAGGER